MLISLKINNLIFIAKTANYSVGVPESFFSDLFNNYIGYKLYK